MKKNGFTVIELLTAFSLTTVVVAMLFNIMFSLKKNYNSNEVRSSLSSEQAHLSFNINRFVYEKDARMTMGSATKYLISYKDASGNTVSKNINIDADNKKITMCEGTSTSNCDTIFQSDDATIGTVTFLTRTFGTSEYTILTINITGKDERDYSVDAIYFK